MNEDQHIEYPRKLQPQFERAKKLEWITFVYVVSVVILMFIVMGRSQAMKTAWADDTIGLVSPISFLFSSVWLTNKPNRRFPYGYHRVANIAYLSGSLALFILGGYLLVDAVTKLINGERASIGMVDLFGKPIWSGYLMMVVLLWSIVPAYFLGKAKLPIAKELHEKVLYADAETNRADWIMGLGAMLGIFGIGWGWYWADSVVAGILSVDIILNGFKNLKQAIFDLINEVPKTVEGQEEDPINQQLYDLLSQMHWIKDVKIRLREEGHVFYGEALVVPEDVPDVISKMKEATKKVYECDWRIKDFLIGIVEKV